MTCKQCGKTLEGKPSFCPYCGAPIGKSGKVAVRIISVFLSILLGLALLVSCAVTAVRGAITEESLTKWASELNPSQVTLPLGDNGAEVPLSDYLHDIAKTYPSTQDLSKEDIEAILDSDVISDFLGKTMGEYGSYLVDGGEVEGLTAEKVTLFLKENEDAIQEAAKEQNVKLDLNIDYDKLEADLATSMGDTAVKPDALLSEEDLHYVRLALSSTTMIICWAVAGALALLLVVLNLKKVTAMLAHIGIPSMVSGLLYCIPALVLTLVPAVLSSMGVEKTSLIYKAIGLVLIPLLIYGGILAVAGIVLLVIRAILRSARKKRAKAAKATV